jgi:hypothetical protein
MPQDNTGTTPRRRCRWPKPAQANRAQIGLNPYRRPPGSAGHRRPETPPSPWLVRRPPPRCQDFVRRRFQRRRGRGEVGRAEGGSRPDCPGAARRGRTGGREDGGFKYVDEYV